MSKIIKLYLLMIMTILNAGNIEQEIGINIGLDSTRNEDGNKFENPSFGLTYQNNKYIVSPRVDVEYVNVTHDQADALLKASVNGVYEYENKTYTIPYALVGVGYEYVKGSTKDVFESHPFVQAGAGVRVDLEQGFKARVEGKVLKVLGGNDEGNEFILTAGISMPLGFQKPVKKARPIVRRIVQPVPTPVFVKRPIQVVHSNGNECSIKISAPDFDRDGIPNNIDQCPATPCNFTVDTHGCPVKTRLEIHFESNSAEIKRTSFPRVYQFAQFLLKNKGSRVKIVGHTDSKGSASYNLGLSQRRARAIVNSLVQQGVSPSRVEAFGEGERMPVTTNTTAEGRAMNRRIEAELSYPKGRR